MKRIFQLTFNSILTLAFLLVYFGIPILILNYFGLLFYAAMAIFSLIGLLLFLMFIFYFTEKDAQILGGLAVLFGSSLMLIPLAIVLLIIDYFFN